MQLKRYEAPTMHEALQLIKGDLGEDAVIFSTKTIEPPRTLRAKRSKKWVEVTAAVERPVNNQLQTGSDNSMMACAEPTELGGTLPGHAEPPDGLKQSSGDTGSALTCGLVHPTLIQQLLNAGIDQALAGHLYGEACMEYGRAQNTRAIDEVLLTTIASRLSIDGPVMLQPGERKKVAFIGPTGVGKTTTLAKIASTYARCSNVKVKIITMDTYRIAAAEQLRIYARIMGLPVVVVSTWQELGNELNRDDGSQLVLIDTAGRNYRDEAQIDELSVWLQAYSDIEAHLLLSSTTSLEVLEATIRSFKRARIDRIIVTKVDESIILGGIYTKLVSSKIPLSYFTIGQRVPEDIRPASDALLARSILHGYGNTEEQSGVSVQRSA